MRLSEQQQQDIIECVTQHISIDARIWLFGSRVDDAKKGGDIDLYIQVDDLEDIFMRTIRCRLALEDRWGARKVDLLVHDTVTEPELAIHAIAQHEGIRLDAH